MAYYPLPTPTYDKLSEIDQGAIVDNKRLGRALRWRNPPGFNGITNRSQSVPSGDGPFTQAQSPDDEEEIPAFFGPGTICSMQFVKLQTRAEEILVNATKMMF